MSTLVPQVSSIGSTAYRWRSFPRTRRNYYTRSTRRRRRCRCIAGIISSSWTCEGNARVPKKLERREGEKTIPEFLRYYRRKSVRVAHDRSLARLFPGASPSRSNRISREGRRITTMTIDDRARFVASRNVRRRNVIIINVVIIVRYMLNVYYYLTRLIINVIVMIFMIKSGLRNVATNKKKTIGIVTSDRELN